MENKQNAALNSTGAAMEILVLHAKNKDQNAIAQLYQLSQPRLRQAISTLVRDSYDVEDIIQDSFLLAMDRLEQLQQPAAFMDWITQIAINQSKNYLAKKQPLRFTDIADEEGRLPERFTQSQAPPIEANLERGEIAATLNKILSTLSASERSVICMYYYDQFSVREIAEKLCVSSSSVRVLMHRGRKKTAARVRALEKQGMQLYGLAPFPFLLMLMDKLRAGETAPSNVPLTPTANVGAAPAGASISGGASAAKTAVTATGQIAIRSLLLKGAITLAAVGACVGIAVGTAALINSQNRKPLPTDHTIETKQPAIVSESSIANSNPVIIVSAENQTSEPVDTATNPATITTASAEPLPAEDVSLYTVPIRDLMQTVSSSQMKGRLYDLNGDGIRELVIMYDKMADYNYMGSVYQKMYCFCNVYTLQGGAAVPLIENEKVVIYVATNIASAGIYEINGELKLIVRAGGSPTPYLENSNYLEIDSLFTIFSFDGQQISIESRNKSAAVWTVARESGGIGTDKLVEDLSYCVFDGEQSTEQMINGLGVGDVVGEKLPYSQYQAWYEEANCLDSFYSDEYNGLFNATPEEMLEYFLNPQEQPY